jgi:preprotein translocase subunit SecD
VETDKAVEASVDNIAADLQTTAALQGLSATFTRTGQEVTARFAETLEEKVEKLIKDTYATLEYKSRAKGELVYGLTQAEVRRLKENAVQQALEITRRRIDKYGVAEPSIYKQQNDQIALQLPGIKNPQEAIAFIKTAGRLEFKMLNETGDLQQALAGKVPADSEVLYGEDVDQSGKIVRNPYLVYKQTMLTGDRLKEAKVGIDDRGRPAISISFDGQGAEIFGRVTGENATDGHRVDNVVASPRDRPDLGGDAQITGNTYEEAAKLAIALREPPAPEDHPERQGRRSDRLDQQGVRAALFGAVVAVFMVVYYRMSGLDGLCHHPEPGLLWRCGSCCASCRARIILTIGMGVRPNVLMFERIRRRSCPQRPRAGGAGLTRS